MAETTNLSWEFHKAEYLAIREEVLVFIKQIDRFTTIAIGAAAVSAGWITVNGANLPDFYWFGPLAVVAVSYAVVEGIKRHIRLIGAYTCKLEATYADRSLQGWSTYYRSQPRNLARRIGNRSTWILMLVAGLFFAGHHFWPGNP